MTEQEELEEILNVFTSIGWKLIIKDMIDLRNQLEKVDRVNTIEELHKAKGELERLNWFINLKEWYQFSAEYEADIRV